MRNPFTDNAYCAVCNLLVNDIPIHVISICKNTAVYRLTFLTDVRREFGDALFQELLGATPEHFYLKLCGADTQTEVRERLQFHKVCYRYIIRCVQNII